MFDPSVVRKAEGWVTPEGRWWEAGIKSGAGHQQEDRHIEDLDWISTRFV